MAEALDTLIKALATKWAATAGLGLSDAIPARRKEKATDTAANPASGTQFPYCVVDDDPSRISAYSCANEYWDHHIKFKLYSTSPENCATLAATVKGVFDSDSLSLPLDEGSVVFKRPGMVRYVEEDKGVWFAEVSYDFTTSKPRTA